MEDDELIKPLDPEEEDELDEDLPDDLILGGKGKKKKLEGEDESLDALADDEDELLPEDEFDDVDNW